MCDTARLSFHGGRGGSEPQFLHDNQVAVVDDDMDKLSLFADTAGGGAAVNKKRGEDVARAKVAAAHNLQRLEAAE